jgi:two-component system chemotaxis response regulator CheY
MSAEGCRRTVLVIEDDTDIREALAEVIEDGNYHAVGADNGEVALQKLRGGETIPCVILLDMMMPVMDGREFLSLQQNDATLKEIPVVLLSAHADAARAAAQLKAAAFLKKPIDLRELLRVIDRFCQATGNPASNP